MYSLHLVTCIFTRVMSVLQSGHHRRQDLVVDYPISVAVATTVLVEKPRGQSDHDVMLLYVLVALLIAMALTVGRILY